MVYRELKKQLVSLCDVQDELSMFHHQSLVHYSTGIWEYNMSPYKYLITGKEGAQVSNSCNNNYEEC